MRRSLDDVLAETVRLAAKCTPAQAALLLEGGDADLGRRGFLAGLEGFVAKRAPRAGEVLSVDVRLTARFGAIVRFDGEVSSGGEQIASGAVLVRRGDSAAGSPS